MIINRINKYLVSTKYGVSCFKINLKSVKEQTINYLKKVKLLKTLVITIVKFKIRH